jgi:hypothetical protein
MARVVFSCHNLDDLLAHNSAKHTCSRVQLNTLPFAKLITDLVELATLGFEAIMTFTQ